MTINLSLQLGQNEKSAAAGVTSRHSLGTTTDELGFATLMDEELQGLLEDPSSSLLLEENQSGAAAIAGKRQKVAQEQPANSFKVAFNEDPRPDQLPEDAAEQSQQIVAANAVVVDRDLMSLIQHAKKYEAIRVAPAQLQLSTAIDQEILLEQLQTQPTALSQLINSKLDPAKDTAPIYGIEPVIEPGMLADSIFTKNTDLVLETEQNSPVEKPLDPEQTLAAELLHDKAIAITSAMQATNAKVDQPDDKVVITKLQASAQLEEINKRIYQAPTAISPTSDQQPVAELTKLTADQTKPAIQLTATVQLTATNSVKLSSDDAVLSQSTEVTEDAVAAVESAADEANALIVTADQPSKTSALSANQDKVEMPAGKQAELSDNTIAQQHEQQSHASRQALSANQFDIQSAANNAEVVANKIAPASNQYAVFQKSQNAALKSEIAAQQQQAEGMVDDMDMEAAVKTAGVELPATQHPVMQQHAPAVLPAALAGNGASGEPAVSGQPVLATAANLAAAATSLVSAQTKTTVLNAETLALLEPTAANQLKERVMFQLNQKIQVAELRLHPEEFGSVQIKVSLQQDQLSLQFVVQQANAKEALEQQMPRLKELLQQQGMQLAEGQVEQRQSGERQASDGHSGQQGRFSQEDAESKEVLTQQVQIKHSDRMVDYYA